MARPREFEPEEAVARATEVFWRKGYRATSVQDLVRATGLNRGSIYAAFGSKAGLFAAVMDRYIAGASTQRLLGADDGMPVKILLRDLFDELVEMGATDRERRGCLITNTAIELTSHDREVAGRISANLRDLEEALCRRLERAQESGEITRERDARALARFLVGSMQGLRVMSKVTSERDVLRDIADVALSSLD